MRDLKQFLKQYKETSLITDADRYVLRDIAIVDLCLCFISEYCDAESTAIIPGLLQGHLASLESEEFKRALFVLRQYAGNLSSQLAWRKALTNHKAFHKAAFSAGDNGVVKRENASNKLLGLLQNTLLNIAPYTQREIEFPKSEIAYIRSRKSERLINIKIPKIDFEVSKKIIFERRAVNPPVLITWEQLYKVAALVDKREAEKDFPAWLEPLNLESRLRRIRILNAEKEFNMANGILLDGVQHVVGMLSSGKSTLLQAILFALVASGYQKRVLYLVPDTATATKIVARLKAHGINQSTVLSSLHNRDEHLSMIHWNAQGFHSDEALSAVAAFTESFGTACPLMGFQQDAAIVGSGLEDGKSLLSEKPCHNIYQSGTAIKKLSCPFISKCPTHSQQQQLFNAQVVVMTPQAFLHMTPDKSVVSESISFPEFFQYQSDVVLIDEADQVQSTFDKECAQEVDLLSGSEKAFALSNQRALASSITERSGKQYSSVTNVKWHHELNRLQSCISATYHLLLQHGDKLRWITEGRTFTGLSILADLSKVKNTTVDHASSNLEQIALLGSMLYARCNLHDNEAKQKIEQEQLNDRYSEIFDRLSQLQDSIIDHVVGEKLDELIEQIIKDLKDEKFDPLRGEKDLPLEKERTHSHRTHQKGAPSNHEYRAYAIVLALLTNWTLSSFTYLVRNQSAVEEDFDLSGDDTFREANRIFQNFGSLIPRPLFGTVFGLTFEPVSDSAQGGTLKLVNHLGVGRYLLTHLNQLLAAEGQAGPHVLLMSGTSWAGGGKEDASPIYDVQLPVSAILEQPVEELESLTHSRFEFVSLGESSIRVSGLPPVERKQSLRMIAHELVKAAPSGTHIQRKWSELESLWNGLGSAKKNRKRALLVTNNYEDAKSVANQLSASAGLTHSIYCLVSDQSVRKGALKKADNRSIEALSPNVNVVPRSKVEEFGLTPEGSILVAPLTPISRGHNIITSDGYAAISTIYFLHRPHPRPDDYSSVIGMVNKLALDFMRDEIKSDANSFESLNRWYTRKAKEAVAKGFDLRTSYSYMPDIARTQFAWDLMTSLWQTIGRGIRKGVPIYVGFIDSQFAPGIYKTPFKQDTRYSSCLVQMKETLGLAIEDEKNEVAKKLYLPLYNALKNLLDKK